MQVLVLCMNSLWNVILYSLDLLLTSFLYAFSLRRSHLKALKDIKNARNFEFLKQQDIQYFMNNIIEFDEDLHVDVGGTYNFNFL